MLRDGDLSSTKGGLFIMAKNDLILLDGLIDEYVSQKLPSEDLGEVFEFFATEQILKEYAFSKEQIMSGSVDGRNDGGIDEFFVLVNGHLAENIPPDFWPKSNAELEVYIITCKHDSSFKQPPITTMIPSLIELLDFTRPSSSLLDSYNEKLLKKRELLISSYKRLAVSLAKFDIHLIYTCRGDETIEPNIQTKADQAVSICQEYFSDCSALFTFWGNSKLLAKYREHPNSSLDLIYDQCVTQDGQYIVLANLHNYCRFITDANGKLNRHLFDSNVRDYLGLNPVNSDIRKSLDQVDGPNFWWLNNGITIIGSQAHIVGNSITIQNVQIVNGLQTSESIYNYFSTQKPEGDLRSVLVKILITNDLNTSKSIIYATNNQTNVNVTALRATDKLQQDIEDILKTHGIYYERRTNYYQNQGIQEHNIITPLSLAAGYVCLLYKSPFVATTLKQKFMRNDFKYGQVFSPHTNLNVWYPVAHLLKKTDEILMELRPRVVNKAIRYLKNYRHIVLFLTISRLLGTFAFSEKDLIEFDLSKYSRDEVEKSINDLLEVDPNCFDKVKKLPSGFYSSCYAHVEAKYGITAVKAIRAKSSQLWPEKEIQASFSLTEEIIESVYRNLPQQPWPFKVHQNVAKSLKLNEVIVSNAISYLIYTERLCDQIYGYVFDKDGNIVAEGHHAGHTEEQAREKLIINKAMREQKFGIISF